MNDSSGEVKSLSVEPPAGALIVERVYRTYLEKNLRRSPFGLQASHLINLNVPSDTADAGYYWAHTFAIPTYPVNASRGDPCFIKLIIAHIPRLKIPPEIDPIIKNLMENRTRALPRIDNTNTVRDINLVLLFDTMEQRANTIIKGYFNRRTLTGYRSVATFSRAQGIIYAQRTTLKGLSIWLSSKAERVEEQMSLKEKSLYGDMLSAHEWVKELAEYFTREVLTIDPPPPVQPRITKDKGEVPPGSTRIHQEAPTSMITTEQPTRSSEEERIRLVNEAYLKKARARGRG